MIAINISPRIGLLLLHESKIKKLENNFGFRDNAKLFPSNYLSNRYQYTRVSNYRLSLRTVTCGVPQGSGLGPLPFLLYVNNFPSSSNSNLFVQSWIKTSLLNL